VIHTLYYLKDTKRGTAGKSKADALGACVNYDAISLALPIPLGVDRYGDGCH